MIERLGWSNNEEVYLDFMFSFLENESRADFPSSFKRNKNEAFENG